MPLRYASLTAIRWGISRCLGAIGMVLLAAVPVLGLTVLRPGMFSAWPAPSKDTPVAGSWGPFTFDAPTTTRERMKMVRLEVDPRDSGKGDVPPEEVILSDWRFTQYHRHRQIAPSQPSAEALLLAELQYIESLLLQLLAQLNNKPANSASS
jgi:hypothetical protein